MKYGERNKRFIALKAWNEIPVHRARNPALKAEQFRSCMWRCVLLSFSVSICQYADTILVCGTDC